MPDLTDDLDRFATGLNLAESTLAQFVLTVKVSASVLSSAIASIPTPSGAATPTAQPPATNPAGPTPPTNPPTPPQGGGNPATPTPSPAGAGPTPAPTPTPAISWQPLVTAIQANTVATVANTTAIRTLAVPKGGQGTNTPAAPGQPAGGQGQQGQQQAYGPLVTALQANTAATTANTAATAGKRGQQGGAGGSGGAGGKGGNFGAEVKDTEIAFERFGTTLESVFTRGRSTILSLVAASDYVTFATLQSSIEAVAIQLGAVFAPYVEVASLALQSLADWLKSLDKDTKGWIGAIGASVVALAGLGTAIITTNTLLGYMIPGYAKLTIGNYAWAAGSRVLATTLTGLGVVVRGLGTAMVFLVTNPIGIAITAVAGLAAGVMYLTGCFDKLGLGASKAGSEVAGMSRIKPPEMLDAEKPPDVNTTLLQLPAAARQSFMAAKDDKARAEILTQLRHDFETELTTAKQSLAPSSNKEFEDAKKRHEIIAEQHSLLSKSYEFRREHVEKLPRTQEASADSIEKTPAGKAMIEEQETRKKAAQEAAKRAGVSMPDSALTALNFPLSFAGKTATGIKPLAPLSAPTEPAFLAPVANPRIKEVERIIETINTLGKLVGIDTLTPAADKKSGPVHDIKLPIQARYTEAMGFAESVQTQALNVSEQEAKNIQERMANSLKILEGTGELLKSIDGNLKALQEAVGKLRFWK